MDGPVGANLDALRQASGVRLPSASAISPKRLLTVTSDGAPLLRTADERTVRLGSTRDPRREAEALIASALGGEQAPDAIAVLGAGTGAVLNLLAGLPVRRILVIEPDAELAWPWLSSRSWLDLIQANRLRLIVGPDYVGAAEAARFLEGVDRLPVIAHPVLTREYPDDMTAARRALDRVVRDALANATARQRFEDLALANTLRNLPALALGADAEALFGRFPDAPAVVVGAGPSLDVNLAAILEVHDRALIIAADTALLPCLRAGVVPSLVVALDPSEENGRHLVAAAAAASDTYLVAEASVDPTGVEAFAGRTFVFRVGDHAPWPWLLTAGVARGRLSVWGSVATAGLDLALRAGCPAVAFAGLDLAFTSGRPYCRGTVFEEGWAWAVANGTPLQAHWELLASTRTVVDEPDVHGRLTPSAAHLLAFRDWIRETTIAHAGIRFANATGAGILHGSRIAQQPLPEFLRGYREVGRAAFASTVRSAFQSSAGAGAGRRIATRLRDAHPLDVVRGHSAPERAASDHAGRDRLAEAARLVDASRAVPSDAAVQATGPTIRRIHLPEQTALLQSLTSGTAHPVAGADRQRAGALLLDAYDLLAGLTARARGVRPIHQVGDLLTVWYRVPARLLFAWPADLAAAVDSFGSMLADAIRLVGGAQPLPGVDVPPAGDGRQCEAAVDRARTSALDPEAELAPATLIWQWSLVDALTVAIDPRLTRAAITLLRDPPGLVPANRPATRLTGWLERSGPDGTAGRLPFLPGLSTARALSGLVATSAAGGVGRPARPGLDPEVRLDLSETGGERLAQLAPIEPESLVARGHPRAHLVARLSDHEVAIGRSDGSGIAVMSESGALVRVETWPMPVRASIPLGAHGRLAWYFPDAPRLLHRDLATGRVEVIELPVGVFDALERADGAVYLATDDGLWRWRPGRLAEPLVRGPWLVSLSASGAGVQARERPRRDHDGRWDATTAILEWLPGDPAFRTIPVAPGTAPFSVAEHRGWRAEAWLDGCVVRLARPDGTVFWLACAGPRSLAWAGSTLYVATAAGEVLRFPDVATRLAAG